MVLPLIYTEDKSVDTFDETPTTTPRDAWQVLWDTRDVIRSRGCIHFIIVRE